MPATAALALVAAAAAVADNVTVVCIADRSKSPDVLGAGLSYACSTGGVNCTAINEGGAHYYPNNIYTHCDYAFEAFYKANPVPTSCDFGGAAYLVNCSTNCTKCEAKDNVTDTQLQKNLDYLCSPDNLGDLCAAIQPGGSDYMPNTTLAHANWAMNTYYQVYRCASAVTDSCDFSDSAAVVSC